MDRLVFLLTTIGATTTLTFTPAPGTYAQSPDRGSVSPHVGIMISHAKEAAEAVACGFRDEEWERNLRERIRGTLDQHAGSPYENDHTPSELERSIALRALDRTAAAGRLEARNSVVCDFIQSMSLSDLDDIADGAKALWARSGRRSPPSDVPLPGEEPRLDWVKETRKTLSTEVKIILSARACGIDDAKGSRPFFLATMAAGQHLTRVEIKAIADWLVATDFGPDDASDCPAKQAAFDKLVKNLEGR